MVKILGRDQKKRAPWAHHPLHPYQAGSGNSHRHLGHGVSDYHSALQDFSLRQGGGGAGLDVLTVQL